MKRRNAAKGRATKRADAMKAAMAPRVVHYNPGLNPHYYPESARKYYVPNPFGAHIVVPACPGYHDWMNSRYYHKIKNDAVKARYSFARNHCMKKGLSMNKRYECFKLHWKQYRPGSKNTIHQVRNRVQKDCMKYRHNPRLRRMCFKAHVKHYQTKLLLQLADADEAEAELKEEEKDNIADADAPVDAEGSGSDEDSLVLVKEGNDSDSDTDSDSGSD